MRVRRKPPGWIYHAPSGTSPGGMQETSTPLSSALGGRVGVAQGHLQDTDVRPATAVGPGIVWTWNVDRAPRRLAGPSRISTATMSQAPAGRRIVVESSDLLPRLLSTLMVWVGQPGESGRRDPSRDVRTSYWSYIRTAKTHRQLRRPTSDTWSHVGQRIADPTDTRTEWTQKARAVTRAARRPLVRPLTTTRVQWRTARRSLWPTEAGRGSSASCWSLRGREGRRDSIYYELTVDTQ